MLGDRPIAPTLGLSLVLGVVLPGIASEIAPPTESSAGAAATVLAVPAESGSVAFEIPAGLAGRDVVLIVSSMGTDGPYQAWCSVAPGEGDATAPDLLALGAVLDLAEVNGPVSSAAGADPPPVDQSPAPPAAGRPPLRRAFAVQARPGDPAVPSHYDLVDARLRAVGDLIQVFVDEDDVSVVGDDVLRNLVSAFDREIEPRFSGWIGRPLDVDRDGRFTVLLSRRVGLPFADGCHVDGYFRAADLDPALPRPLSNRADLVYLDAGLHPGPYLETVLAHEYAHAVLESRRRERGGPAAEEAWLDEALAHLCEDRAGRSAMNLDYRVGAFLADPGRARLVVEDEHQPGRFRSHGNRGGAYLFLRWCAETFDPDLPRTLSTGGETGAAGLERATGLPFAELYRRWAVALVLASADLPPGGPGGLDLLDGIGDWPLGGLRFVEIEAGEGPRSLLIEGTGSQFLRLSTPAGGPARVELRCDPAAAPMVTAVVLDSPAPRLVLDVAIADMGPESSTLIARVRERAGIPARLDRLCWESLSPPPGRPRAGLHSIAIRDEALAALFPDPSLPGRMLRSSEPLPIPTATIRDGPLVFRLSARGPDGARVVAWAELHPPPKAGPAGTRTLASHRGSLDGSAPGPTP